ncbi:MAG: endolytic transglycosylase MltG [Calditrichaeota bacterium]|nr:MAG: endolytic transglycosylase MltG [Calditrichota bacterium]
MATKRNNIFISIIVGLLAVVLLVVFVMYSGYTSESDLGDKSVTIIIKQGDSFNSVLSKLLDDKVIDSKFMMKLMAKLSGADKKLVPGRYDFSGKNSAKSVLEKLENGDFFRVKVTIPEGNTIWETASLLARKLELDSAQIHQMNFDTLLLKKYNLPYLEGYLYPETYYFPWGSSEREVVETLIEMFITETSGIWLEQVPNNLSREEVVIMASIIEGETGLVDERRLVSSVYHNRLTKRMKLDADPTVIYGLGGLDRPLWKKDLKKDSPYNTYLRRGLPPTPINSPGAASIKAAMNPEKSEYFYFVADTDGSHYFSRTNAEHNRAIQRIRSKQN